MIGKGEECQTEVLCIQFIVSLPEWITQERFHYEVRRIHPQGHVWAGQVDFDNIQYENSALDAIGDLPNVREICSHPMGPWVQFEIPANTENIRGCMNQLHRMVEKILEELSSAAGAAK
jgi:hypothetical protein